MKDFLPRNALAVKYRPNRQLLRARPNGLEYWQTREVDDNTMQSTHGKTMKIMFALLKNRESLIATTCAIGFSALALSSCGDSKEVSFNSGGMTQTSRAGDTSVPDDLKKLVYPGATASGSQSASENGKDSNDHSRYLNLSTSDSIEKVAAWYESALKKEGWNIEKNEAMGNLVTISGTLKDAEVAINIADDSGKTSIIVNQSTSIGAIPDDEAVENFKPNKEVPPTD